MAGTVNNAESRRLAFGAALAEARKARGVSQGRLGRLLDGATQSTVSSWEIGVSEPDPFTVFAIEQALGTTPGFLSRHLGYCPCDDPERVDPPPACDAIAADARLSPYSRKLLLTMYREMTKDDGAELEED